MGFSLVGNSGDQKTTNNVYETTYTASLNPQLDQQGAGPGDIGVNVSPNFQGTNAGGSVDTNLSSNFAPVNVVSTGSNLGDTALAALQAISANQASDTQGPGVAAPASTLSTLLSGNTLYWILGAIVVLFLAHKK
jgi:hypothetical protein